jgi:NitT/TauT family transport system permease protein
MHDPLEATVKRPRKNRRMLISDPHRLQRHPQGRRVPISVLWFGIGTIAAVLTAFLISFFPIVVNVATGLATIEPEPEDVLKGLGASKLDIMRKVGIPRSLPNFFGSLKIGIWPSSAR